MWISQWSDEAKESILNICRHANLSVSETRVFVRALSGMQIDKIAADLSIHPRTVSVYKAMAFRKLEADLLSIAMQAC